MLVQCYESCDLKGEVVYVWCNSHACIFDVTACTQLSGTTINYCFTQTHQNDVCRVELDFKEQMQMPWVEVSYLICSQQTIVERDFHQSLFRSKPCQWIVLALDLKTNTLCYTDECQLFYSIFLSFSGFLCVIK